jgi:PKHD-type hydroxylase
MAGLTPVDLPTAQALVAGSAARMAPAVELPSIFSAEECRRIIGLRTRLGVDAAPIPVRPPGEGAQRRHEVQEGVRKTERTHIMHNREQAWIFERLAAAVEKVNSRAWDFRVAHMEPLQLLVYPEGGHFDWHSDLGDRGIASLRKVSATIHLSAYTDYEGGDFQLMSGGQAVSTQRAEGHGVFFPSLQNHRVLPVTRGQRAVLILWTIGRHPLR